jgi:hypothetical protein
MDGITGLNGFVELMQQDGLERIGCLYVWCMYCTCIVSDLIKVNNNEYG